MIEKLQLVSQIINVEQTIVYKYSSQHYCQVGDIGKHPSPGMRKPSLACTSLNALESDDITQSCCAPRTVLQKSVQCLTLLVKKIPLNSMQFVCKTAEN